MKKEEVRFVFAKYDEFFNDVYGEAGAFDRKTKYLIALAASLAAGCEPWTSFSFAVAKESGATQDELDETVAIAMTIGATKIRALADKVNPSISTTTAEAPVVNESVAVGAPEKSAANCFTWAGSSDC